jgi:hypothetical protein
MVTYAINGGGPHDRDIWLEIAARNRFSIVARWLRTAAMRMR